MLKCVHYKSVMSNISQTSLLKCVLDRFVVSNTLQN